MLQSKSKIYKYFKSFADAHQTIERIGFEFEEQLENFAGEEKEYPILFVSPLDSPTLDNRGLREMGFRIHCLDIIQVSDRSNVPNIINKTDLILYDFIQFFHQDGDSDIYIQGQPIVIPTNNHLTDYCSGHYIDVLIQSKTGNSCGAPMVGYTPPPSGECDDGFNNIQQSDGTLIQAVTVPSGLTVNSPVADSVITLKDTATNVLSTTNVKATDTADITAPDGTVTVDNTDGTQVDSGTVVSGGSGTFTAPNGTVEVNQSGGTLIQSVTVVSNGLQPYNVADSPITVNGAAFADVKATDSLDIPVHDSNGGDVGTVNAGVVDIADSDVTANGDAFGSVVAEGSIDVPIEDEDGNTLDTTVVGGVVQVFLYWYMIAVLAYRTRMIDEGATFETDESLTNNLLELGETEFNDALLVLTPEGYSTGVKYAVKPNDGSGDFSYTQNTANGTRINENGEIEILPANTPRITWDNGEPLILVEESRTNLVTYSDDYTQADWGKLSAGTGLNPVITPNFAPSIFEGKIAQRVDLNLNGGVSTSDFSYLNFSYNTVLGENYTGSIFVKAATPTDVGKDFIFRPLGGPYVTVFLTDTWNKIEFTLQANSTSTALQIQLRGSFQTSDNISLLLTGIQNEKASDATSTIPTTGATATRNDDIYTVTPPAGTTEIHEYLANGTVNVITTIPATYEPAPGLYKKIVFK